jgi:hypothetical protein
MEGIMGPKGTVLAGGGAEKGSKRSTACFSTCPPNRLPGSETTVDLLTTIGLGWAASLNRSVGGASKRDCDPPNKLVTDFGTDGGSFLSTGMIVGTVLSDSLANIDDVEVTMWAVQAAISTLVEPSSLLLPNISSNDIVRMTLLSALSLFVGELLSEILLVSDSSNNVDILILLIAFLDSMEYPKLDKRRTAGSDTSLSNSAMDLLSTTLVAESLETLLVLEI